MKLSVLDCVREACAQLNFPYSQLSATSFFSIEEMLRWYNMMQCDFVRISKCLRYSYSLSTTTNQQEYAYPSDASIIELLWMLCDGIPLRFVQLGDLEQISRAWRYAAGGASGTPEYYYISNIKDQQFGLYPCPVSTHLLTVVFLENPPIASSISSTIYPKIDDAWHDAISYGIEWQGHRKKKDWEAATSARGLYLQIAEQAYLIHAGMYRDLLPKVQGTEYSKPTLEQVRDASKIVQPGGGGQ